MSPSNAMNESRITISHAGCRGTCGVYDITLLPTGAVMYNGVRSVRTVGIAQARLAPGAYEALLRDFEKIDFFSLEECPLAMDAPTAITTITAHGKSRAVQHNYGCDALAELERKVEGIVNSRQWTE